MVSLTLDYVRSRLFLEDHSSPAPAGLLPAGVLAPVFLAGGDVSLLFTQRTMNLKAHQGQISFPGGVKDPEDPDLLATALRETEEEIGLKPAEVEILGTLNPVATTTGYWIKPFVAVIPYPYGFRLNRQEVNRLLIFPLKAFCVPERWSSGPYHHKGQTVQVRCWKYQGTVIWGATACMILDLLSRLGEHPLSQQCID
jgi:8-oxo-dGTP pyrophosphatase MutT (NUDIX family)|uniref:CoA pyrophosphatase n=1 Tax=Desulfobacca acetoxidans TaxID=60893 RepID=A0A7V6A5R0_9BACT